MTNMRAWGTAVALIFACEMAFAASKVDFSRYEIILSRKPFGEPPAEAANPSGAPAATTFIKDIRMCVITEHPEFGIRVGFMDIAAKKNYYLGVGDTEDGIQLVDADYEKEAALLQKGADSFWINMTGQVNPGSSGPVQASGSPVGSQPGPGVTATFVKTASTTPERMSYAERSKLRREAMERRTKEIIEKAKEVDAEKQKAALSEYQMELVRAGGSKGPAIPIPLTKEMDDQLVAEGVLPSADASGSESDTSSEPAADVSALEPPQQ